MNDVRVTWLKEVDSTNSLAMRSRHDYGDFTVWGAEFQSAGRGQRGNVWESKRGENLMFSILLKPDNFLSVNQFVLSEIVALGVVSYLADLGLDARIKWPNDIYIGDKKICGILIENVLSGDRLSVCVAGVGLNLNQKSFESDAPNPISVALAVEKDDWIEPKEALANILGHIAKLYFPMCDSYDPAPIERMYLEKLYRKDILSQFQDLSTGERFFGYIRGVEKNACLRIETQTGTFRSFAFKELKYIL